MKTRHNPFLRSIAFAAATLALSSHAVGATYQWDGSDSGVWSNSANWANAGSWNTQTITAGPAPTGVTAGHRLNVNNQTGSELVYSADFGTTTYANGTGRGIVIGSGTTPQGGSGNFRITGGKFSTDGTTGGDIIGNNGNVATFVIDGGEYQAGGVVNMGIGGGPTCTFTINDGLATVSTLSLNNTTGVVNLNGGALALNQITRSAGTNTINFNGGTLRARQNNPSFIAAGINAITTAGTSTIDTNGFNVSILSGISGSGTLNKNNGGRLTLTAANTYTGNLVINAGTVALAPTAAAVFAGSFSGAGALEIGGTGRVSLTADHTHTGGTTVLNGAGLGGEGSLSGALTFAGTSSMAFDPSTTGANQHFRANSIDASSATVSIVPSSGVSGNDIVVMESANPISGSIGVNFLGNSRLSLSFNQDNTQLLATYTPASLIWKGNDGVNPTFWNTGVTSNWDNGGSADTFAAGDNVLFDDSALTFDVAIQSTVTPGNITFSSAANYTVTGAAIGGVGNLTKSGAGILTLNTANTFSGTTTVTGGYLVLGSNTALGSTAAGTTVSGTGALDIAGRNLGTEVITISGSGNDAINGQNQGALVNFGAQQLDAIGRLVLAGNATIGGSNRWDLRNSSPTLDMGGFTLTKAGSNMVSLVGVAVSNPGHIDVSGGILSVETSTTMGGTDANTITVRSGAMLSSWQGANPVPWSLDLKNLATVRAESAAISAHNTWSGPVAIEAGGVVTVNAMASMTFSGVISGAGSGITKTSAGVAYLSGANTYTGLTTVSAGGLVLQHASALGTTDAGTTVAAGGRIELDNLTVGGEALDIAGDGGNFFGALQGRSGTSSWTTGVSVTANNTRIGAQAGATLQVSGVISSTSNHALIFRPTDLTSTMVISGANTYTGPTSVVGGVVSVSNIGSVGGGPSNFGNSTTVADGTIHMSLANATGYLRYTGSGETTNRVINLAAPTNGAFLEQAGTGLLKFTSDFSATGAGSKNIALRGSTTGVGEIAGAIVDNSATNTTRITKEGTGTWVLSGNSSFTGSVTISEGVLAITHSNALGTGVKNVTINATADKRLELDGSAGDITLPASFTFFTSGLNGAIRSIAGNNVINSPMTMTIGNGDTRIISDNAGSLTLNGNISANATGRALDLAGNSLANNVFAGVLGNANAPGLIKSGTGTWTLTGGNTYTGATTIQGGTLVIGATGSIDASASLAIAAGGELDVTAKTSHTLPATVTIGLNGEGNTAGLIDAAGKSLDIDGANVTFNITGTLTAPAYVIANYGSISGAAAFASVTAPSGYTINYTYNGGTQIALVKSGTDYDAWMDLYPSITGDDRLPGADADGDGLSNFEEYAFGLNPSSASSVNPISQALSKSGGVFKYTRRATPATTGVTYSYESSTTLSGSWPGFSPVTEISNNASPVEEITVTVPASLLENPQLFIRVRAVKP